MTSTSTSTSTSASADGDGDGATCHRDYSSAIEALNTLQSNAAVIEAIRKSGGRLNDFAIPEMIEYVQRIGYTPDDLNALNVIHITGTKGKGSTSAFCDSLFRQLQSTRPAPAPAPAPAKVGLFTSPHMCAVRERIRINGTPIPQDMFAKYFWQVWDRLAQNPVRKYEHTPLRPVYFRFLTLLAYHVFLQERVDATILEVGIGGKYDSTNIVPRPLVTAITQLGLDHTALLGNTVEEIAVQKAGIFKQGAPALSWAAQPGNSIAQLERVAQQAGTKLELIPLHPQLTRSSIKLGLPGDHQRSNASLAIAIMDRFLASSEGSKVFSAPSELEPESDADPAQAQAQAQAHGKLAAWQRAGIEQARWPGRCQIVPSKTDAQLTWYLDGAHTTDSLAVCLNWFINTDAHAHAQPQPQPQRKRTFIFNCTHGRSARELLKAVLDRIETDLEQLGTPPAPAPAPRSEAGTGAGAGGPYPYPRARSVFDTVIFCTNITFSSGGWASGE